MWPRRSDVLAAGVSATEVAWCSGGGPVRVIAGPAEGGSVDAVAAGMQAAMPRLRPATVHVVAGSSVARHWLQVAPPGLRSLAELRALVQSRAEQLFGGEPGWVVAADWHASRPFLCAAVPRDVAGLAAALGRALRARACVATTLTRALPRLARRLPANGWAALHEPQALHCMHLVAGGLGYLRSTVLAPGLGADALAQVVKAEIDRSAALAGGLPTGPLVQVSLAADPLATQAQTALAQAHGGRQRAAP